MPYDDDNTEKAIQTHQPCPDCGSSDALAIYAHHNFCHSCEKRTKTDGEVTDNEAPSPPAVKDLSHITYCDLTTRRITEETCRIWSYGRTEWFGETVQCAQYLDNNRRVVAQKIRTRDKEFPWKNRPAFKGLYGQWLWRDGGKQVVITEGELDALSVSQVQNNKWPVVSLPDGGGTKALKSIQQAMTWLNKFEKIILFFDNDDPGRDTVDLVKKILPMGKVWIAWTPEGFKDASDMLVAYKGKELIDCLWGAKEYRPDGLVNGSVIIDRLLNRPVVQSFPYPDYMEKLNYMTGGGIRMGELDTWTSGTGMGKTTLIKALQNHYFNTTTLNQALIHLEEPLEDTGDDLVAYEAGKRFQIDDQEFRNNTEYLEVAERLFLAKDSEGYKRFQLYDAFGSVEDDSLFEIIRYAAVAEHCQVIWVDHLSILVSDLDGFDDERRKIDRIMHGLKSLTVELNIYIGLISHLRKPLVKGKSFEEGATPTLDDLRGSGGIKQLSNAVFAISRDQQANTPAARNTATTTVLKCRKTGRTGTADFLTFEDTTGRLIKGTNPATLALDAFDNEEVTGDY